MGLFDRKNQTKNSEVVVDEEKLRLMEIRDKYASYTRQFYDKGYIKAYALGENKVHRTTYYIAEDDTQYTCYPDDIGQGAIINDYMAYANALELPTLQLSKSDYTLVLPEDNINRDIKNEFQQDWSVGDVHIQFVSALDTKTFYLQLTPENKKYLDTKMESGILSSVDNLLVVPSDAAVVKLKPSKLFVSSGECLLWRDQDFLCMAKQDWSYMKRTNILSVIKIPVKQIRYYREEGSIRYEQTISGGGGGGVNYGGALVGAILFGGVGAIIGSNAGTEIAPITSETKEVDTRVLCMVITDKNGTAYNVGFETDALDALEWFIPDKEYSYVIQKRREAFEHGGSRPSTFKDLKLKINFL